LVRFTFDPMADAVYVYLTGEPLLPGRDSVVCDEPESRGNGLTVVMDWKAGKLVGVEVLAASSVLHADLLAQAQPPRARQAGADQTET